MREKLLREALRRALDKAVLDLQHETIATQIATQLRGKRRFS
jgi:hypothetical protein